MTFPNGMLIHAGTTSHDSFSSATGHHDQAAKRWVGGDSQDCGDTHH
jgi:hypothetical protein